MTLFWGSAISVPTSTHGYWQQLPEERRRATLNLGAALLAVVVACAGAAMFFANGLQQAIATPDAPPQAVLEQPSIAGQWDPFAPALPAEAVQVE